MTFFLLVACVRDVTTHEPHVVVSIFVLPCIWVVDTSGIIWVKSAGYQAATTLPLLEQARRKAPEQLLAELNLNLGTAVEAKPDGKDHSF